MEFSPVTSMATVLVVLKIFFIVGLSVYSVFALVVVRQIQIMSETVKLGFELPVKIIGVLHLIFALGLLVLSIFAL